jgi:hypothetical protein
MLCPFRIAERFAPAMMNHNTAKIKHMAAIGTHTPTLPDPTAATVNPRAPRAHRAPSNHHHGFLAVLAI